jgi:hypothetical protein
MSTRTISLPERQIVLDIARNAGGVASVFLTTAPAAADPAARWHALTGRLTRADADAAVVGAVERALLAAPAPADGQAVFATGDADPVILQVPGLTGPDRAEWGPVARLAPVLAWLRDRPPYVLVVTDRTGADLYTSAGGGQAPRTTSVFGPDDEIERNAPGGWSQSRYQNRAEDSWRHNAGAVAEACEQALRASGAKLLVISGDVRAVQLLEERLPAWLRVETVIRHISGGRSPDGSQPHRTDRLAEVVRSVATGWTAELLTTFAEQLAPHGLAVDGELATLEALAEGRVAELLVVLGHDDTRTAWFGEEPAQILPTTQNPPASWSRHDRGPLLDLAVRAALLTGAQVHVLDPDTAGTPAEGIGALCRFH